jgi:hypothetical protein
MLAGSTPDCRVPVGGASENDQEEELTPTKGEPGRMKTLTWYSRLGDDLRVLAVGWAAR